MFRKLNGPARLQPAQHGSHRIADDAVRARQVDWRAAARNLARRLMPVMVLVAAAVLGLAAVAMA